MFGRLSEIVWDGRADAVTHRFDRPSWSTGLFIALACIVAAVGGVMMYLEGKKVKKVEGVPVKVAQRMEEAEREVDVELGHVDRRGKSAGKANGGEEVVDRVGSRST